MWSYQHLVSWIIKSKEISLVSKVILEVYIFKKLSKEAMVYFYIIFAYANDY